MKTTLYGGDVTLEFDAGKHAYHVGGSLVVSVTQALKVIDKPALVPWAAKMASEYIVENVKPGVALDEIQIRELADGAKGAHRAAAKRAAAIGTQVHDWAECYAKGERPPMPMHPQIRQGVDAFLAWWNEHDVKIVAAERKCFSRAHMYAGTVDLVAVIGRKFAVLDYKTSSGIWDEYRLQVAAYSQALIEEGFVPADHDRWIVRFDKTDGTFEAVKYERDTYERDARGFRAALALYRALEEIKASKPSRRRKAA